MRTSMLTFGGATPLMYACQQCRENEVLEILRKQPHSVKDRDRTLKSPLHYCAENANSSCAEAILKAAPELVNAQDENGYCTLHLAVIAGNKPLIKLLLSKGADVNIRDNEEHSAVHWAIVSSEKEALDMIIRAGANPSTPDIHGGYPLHYAVQMCGADRDYVRSFEDTVRVVETLLNFGVDVNVKDKDGRQPILWAASAGSADAVIHLVSGGACIEAADKDGLTALHCAASRGHTTTLETLITLCGTNVDVIDGNGCSALFYSVTLGHADATELLLQLGAEPNRQDRKGRTPAHCGAAKGQLETLRILHKHGGNLWMRNVRGDIPLHEAVASGRKDLVLWLLSQCSEAINVANNDGRCPLHIASMYNNTEMVKVLLDSKSLVNPVMRTSKGVLMTPLNVALSKGHRSCGKYLQLHGGVPFSKVSKVEPVSGFSLRVSPSDVMMIVSSEKSKENVLSSQSKIAKSRSSTDLQEHQEIVRADTTDKKKVYRRRKKKKSASNPRNQDSDSDDSIYDVKTKSQDKRKSEKSYEDDSENDEDEEKAKTKKLYLDVKTTKKSPKAASAAKTEEHVNVTKMTTKTESKVLQKNKSFNETKNVSDLSPEDFPPMMQTINQLDIVIMEPDVEVTKPESESQQQKVDSIHESSTVETKKEEIAKNHTETKVVDAAAVRRERESVEREGEKVAKDEEIRKESSDGKNSEERKPNEGVKKNEAGSKSPGSKSSEEGATRKSVRLPKNNEISGKKEAERKKSPERSDKDKTVGLRVPKAEVPEKSDTTVSKDIEKSETKIGNEKEDEYAESEPGVVHEEKTQLNVEQVQEEVIKSEADVDKSIEEPKNSDTFCADKSKPGDDIKIEISSVQESGLSEKAKEKMEEPEVKKVDVNHVEAAEIEIKTPAVGEAGVKTSDLLTVPEEKIQRLPEVLSEPDIENISEKHGLETESQPAGSTEEVTIEHPSHAVAKGTVEFSEPLSEKIEEIKASSEKEMKPSFSEGRKVSREEEIKTSSKENKLSLAGESNLSVAEVNRASTEKESKPSSAEITETSAAEGTKASKGKEIKSSSADRSESRVAEENKASEAGENNREEIVINLPPDGSPRLNDEEDWIGTAEGEEDAKGASKKFPERKRTQSEHRYYKTPRVSRLCRRYKDFKDDMSQVSVTQLVQSTIRKYHMERGIFYQLLELKRYQIRSGRANEQVLVKRLADEYERSRIFLGMKPFTGVYKYREFEKFLYDQLKALNSGRSFTIPEVKSYDDIDALSGFLKKSRYKIISETTQPERICTCITQRCHHSAYAYTSVPCSAYITDLRRHRRHQPKKESFFPRIDQYKPESQKYKERPATLELIQGSEKHVITLPQRSPARGRRYYVTFTIKGAPGFKEDDYSENPRDYLKHRHAKSV